MTKDIKYIDDLIKAKAEIKELKDKLDDYDESVFLLSMLTLNQGEKDEAIRG